MKSNNYGLWEIYRTTEWNLEANLFGPKGALVGYYQPLGAPVEPLKNLLVCKAFGRMEPFPELSSAADSSHGSNLLPKGHKQ